MQYITKGVCNINLSALIGLCSTIDHKGVWYTIDHKGCLI